MKKVIPAVIVLVAVAAVAFMYFNKVVVHHVRATDLAPAETIFFAHFPDLRRSTERWPKTALAQIGAEAEMKTFLAKPRASAPQMKLWDQKIAQLERVAPGEGFVAVTSIEGNSPRFLAGLSFSGRKADMDALLAEGRAELKQNWPAGKADLTMQGRTEIATFTYQDTTIGEAYCEDWYFVSNDVELLRRTIDAAGQGLGEKAVGASDLFKKSTAHLPADGEVVLFAQVATLTDRLISLLTAASQPPDPKQVADWKKIQAIAWGTKFEGALMRDTLFILSPGNAAEAPLAQHALALSDPSTFLTYSTALPASIDMAESSLGVIRTMVPGYAALEGGLAAKGLKLGDFGKAFGPEFGTLLGWGQNAAQPSTLFAMDVRDAATAKGFVEAFADGGAGVPPWGREEKDGVTIYQSPPAQGLLAVSPTIALSDRFVVIGFSQPEVLAGLAQLKTGKGAIAASPAFAQAAKSVSTPTSGYGYLDLKTLVDRAYTGLRPALAMAIAFSPDSAKYVDAGKLPSAEAISKHLSPAVYSQSVSAEGTLIESVGPLTFNQVALVTVGAAVGAAFPLIENAISGGMKLDPSLLQLTPPAPVPPTDTPSRTEAEPAPAEGKAGNSPPSPPPPAKEPPPASPEPVPQVEKPVPPPAPAPQL